ncbi:alpha/beta hydrolase [Lutimonas sp.]|uniref:alpha/beta hydrolase n=1 Tax=Lutimonas sp. TaxID=1872403 RepID=UPI003D9BE635
MEEKIHIYFMPGLAASSKIFEYIHLSSHQFELHYLEWIAPDLKDEDISVYASKFATQIKHKNPVLIGVSFGGILVQEISKLIPVKQLIIISSIKCTTEMPKRLLFIKNSRAYKFFPSKRLSRIDDFSKYDFHPHLKKKSELYNKYLSIRDEKYLNWAIHNVLHWNQMAPLQNTIHIHGSKDEIFPIKHVKNCIAIEGGTHAMIIVKAKKISSIIEKVLST